MNLDSMVCAENALIQKAKLKYEPWIKLLRKSLTRRKWEKKEEDSQQLLTQEDLKTFDNSRHVKQVLGIFNYVLASSTHISTRDYTATRDYLLTNLFLDNAPRSGGLENLQINRVRNAAKDGDMLSMVVLEYKTLDSSRPAILRTTFQMYKLLVDVITKIR